MLGLQIPNLDPEKGLLRGTGRIVPSWEKSWISLVKSMATGINPLLILTEIAG
jgi:hypothetical protein